MQGHLFDSGLINQVLDVVEAQECTFQVIECRVRQASNENKSSILLKIKAEDVWQLRETQIKAQSLVDLIGKADATMKIYEHLDNDEMGPVVSVESYPTQRVLLLGSGLVSKSLAEYLGRDPNREILVASIDEDGARSVANVAQCGRHTLLDIKGDPNQLSRLVKNADIVVSLLPAPMHSTVAEACIKHRKNLVTASYESDEMRSLHER
jgi:alpha-aminoadipic semialdehyde synthase